MDEKYWAAGIVILVAVIIFLILFWPLSNQAEMPLGLSVAGSSGASCSSNGTTVSSPTEGKDSICFNVCVPKPRDCPRDCPPGTHWECSGTIAMNCGCIRDPGTTTTTPGNNCPPPLVWDSGRQTCVSCPIGTYYDTSKMTCVGYV